jgi:Fur family transcriptional regulator, ferric uptake regulator
MARGVFEVEVAMIHWPPGAVGVRPYPLLNEESPMESQELRKAGLKVTHPRMRILDLLETSEGRHLSAEDIYRSLIESGEDIGLATVYRVLTQFEAAGLVMKHNFEGGQAVYELDRGGHHDHMVCVDTGKVIEFYSPDIERLQKEIADQHGYVIEDHSLVLYVRPKRKK